ALLLATATALAPPFLSKYAIDDGIKHHDLAKLWWIVGAFLLAGLLNWGLTNDVEAIDQLVTDGVTSLVQNTLTLVGTAILLFVLDWRLALATLLVIPFMSVATIVFRTRSARAYSAVRERLGLVTAALAEDIAGMRIVQAFTRQRTNMRNFREVSVRYRDSNMETVVLNGVSFPF